MLLREDPGGTWMGRIAQTKTTKDGTLGTYMAKSAYIDAITTFLSSGTLPHHIEQCHTARWPGISRPRTPLNFLFAKLTIYTRSTLKSLLKSQSHSLYAIYLKSSDEDPQISIHSHNLSPNCEPLPRITRQSSIP